MNTKFNNYLAKTIKIGLYAVFLLPVVFTSRTMYPWHFGKTVLFQILIEIIMLLFVFYYFKNGKRLVKFNILDALLLLFVIIQFISAIFGVNWEKSFWGDQSRTQGVFTWLHFVGYYFLLRQFFTMRKDWIKLIIVVLIVSSVSALLAWLGPHISFFEGVISTDWRLGGLIGNPIFLANYLSIPVFFSIALFYFYRQSQWRYLWLGIGFLNLVTILATGVRGTFLGLVVGFLVILVFQFLFSKNKIAKFSFLIAIVLAVVAFSSLRFYSSYHKDFKDNYPNIYRLVNISLSQSTAQSRLMAWQIAYKGWLERPLLGWGPENYRDIFDKYYNPDFLKFSLSETTWDKPHNYPLEVLSSTGILGLLSYLGLAVVSLLFSIRLATMKQSAPGAQNQNKVFVFLSAGLVSYFIQNLFSFESSNSLHLWLALVALISCFYSFDSKEITPITVLQNKLSVKSVAALFIIILVLLPLALFSNVRLYKASILAGDARGVIVLSQPGKLWGERAQKVLAYPTPLMWEQLVVLTQDLQVLDVNNKLNKGAVELVGPRMAELYEEKINQYPHSFFFRFWQAQLYGIMGVYLDSSYFSKSNFVLEEARPYSPRRPQVPLLQAKNYLLEGDDDAAITTLEKMLETDSAYPEPHWFLGLALMKKGDEVRGLKELEAGMDFATREPKNLLFLIDLYAKNKEYDKIIPIYEDLLQIEERNNNSMLEAQYSANLAATYQALKNEEKMLYYLRRAVEVNPVLEQEALEFLKQNNVDVNKLFLD